MTDTMFRVTLPLGAARSAGRIRQSLGKWSTQQPMQYLSTGGNCILGAVVARRSRVRVLRPFPLRTIPD